MNARLRRLYADYQMVMDEFAGHPKIDVTPEQGDPPEVYRVVYHVTGLEMDEQSGRPVERDRHEAKIYLHRDYPREKPKCDLETSIFHPNFGSYICIGDHWAAGETLVDVIIQIGEMIAYQSYNPKSPLNGTAARWARDNEDLFPIDDSDLYQPEVEIDLHGEEEEEESSGDEDLGIELM